METVAPAQWTGMVSGSGSSLRRRSSNAQEPGLTIKIAIFQIRERSYGQFGSGQILRARGNSERKRHGKSPDTAGAVSALRLFHLTAPGGCAFVNTRNFVG